MEKFHPQEVGGGLTLERNGLVGKLMEKCKLWGLKRHTRVTQKGAGRLGFS